MYALFESATAAEGGSASAQCSYESMHAKRLCIVASERPDLTMMSSFDWMVSSPVIDMSPFSNSSLICIMKSRPLPFARVRSVRLRRSFSM